MKRRRLNGKQPARNLFRDEDATEDSDRVSMDMEDLDMAMQFQNMDMADLQLPLDEVAETDVAEQHLSPVDGEVLADDSCPANRFAFLTQKTINQLLVSVLQSKSDEELHGLKIATVLGDVLATSGGKVTEEELADKRDDFIAAAMKQVPRELARRLVSTVQAKSKSEEMDEVQVVQIDSRTWQKAYLITVSGLSPTEAPTREELQRTMLKAFRDAEYTEGKVTHLAIFREPHKSGKLHFHVACCLSVRIRWLPWKRALLKHNINANFNHVELQGIAKQRARQYESMLKYCWVPSRAKPLCCLDPEPLLYHCNGRHPPLMDAIQGTLDAEAISLSIEQKFLQRAQGGKAGPGRFMVSRLRMWLRGIRGTSNYQVVPWGIETVVGVDWGWQVGHAFIAFQCLVRMHHPVAS